MESLNSFILSYICIGILTMLIFLLFADKIDDLRSHSTLQYGPRLIDIDIDDMTLPQIILLVISVFTLFWPAIIYLVYADYKNQRK